MFPTLLKACYIHVMNRIDRLLGILIMLQSKKYVQAEAIAEKYNISIRTVFRDLKALGEQGVPISFEPHKGYAIMQGYFIPPVSFTTDEANALLLMEGLAKGFADKSIKEHYGTALNKVKAVLRHTQKEQVDALSNNIAVQVPPCFNTDFEYLSIIQNAVTAKTILQLHYTSKSEESTLRNIEPIGLIYYAMNWHLIGWCTLRQDYRDFRVSRISKLRNLDKPFTKTDHLALQAYMKQLPVEY